MKQKGGQSLMLEKNSSALNELDAGPVVLGILLTSDRS